MNSNFKQEYTHLTEDIIRALGFAARAHHHQKRKDDLETPYFSHPAGVGIILTKLGCDEETIIAGILHDIIEDTVHSYEDIEKEFSTRVADLVRWVSIPEDKTGTAGKIAYLDNLQKAPKEARMISAADMLYNRADLIFALRNGSNILHRFHIESYTNLEITNRRLELIAEVLGSEHEIVKDLRDQDQILQELIKQHAG